MSCNKDFEIIKVKDDNGNIIEKYAINKESKKKNGTYYRYFKNNQIDEIANYTDGLLDGQRVIFYKSGDTMTVEMYQADKFEGIYRTYHKNGQLESEGKYYNNVMSKKWNYYYDNGQLKEMVTFEHNAENGPFVEYHKNGKLKAKGTYKTTDFNDDANKEHGLLELFDENGELEKKMECELGRCKTIWKKER